MANIKVIESLLREILKVLKEQSHKEEEAEEAK
jgi:hypothetical protein